MLPSNDVYYGTKLATTAEPSILWHQLRDIRNFKLRALSNECCFDFIGQSIYERSHFASLRPSKWRVTRPAGRNFRPYAKWRYSSEPSFEAESKLCTHWILAQPARGQQFDFTSILPLPKLEKLTPPNFQLHKDVVTEHFAPLFNYLKRLLELPCVVEVMDVGIYGIYHYSGRISWCWNIVNVAFDRGQAQQLLLDSATRCPQDTGRGQCWLIENCGGATCIHVLAGPIPLRRRRLPSPKNSRQQRNVL